jgi:hypothetical protein
MIYFDPKFVKTAYPGYLWNTEDQTLYTIKTTGVLRPMTFQRGGVHIGFTRYESRITIPGYQISVGGIRKTITLNYLRTLNAGPRSYQMY